MIDKTILPRKTPQITQRDRRVVDDIIKINFAECKRSVLNRISLNFS